MVSIGFDAVAGLNVLSFTLEGVLPGKVHRITRAATVRSDLYSLNVGKLEFFLVPADLCNRGNGRDRLRYAR